MQTYLVYDEEVEDSCQKLYFISVFVRLVKCLACEYIACFLVSGEIRYGTEKALETAGPAGGRDRSCFISGSGMKVLTAGDGGTVT